MAPLSPWTPLLVLLRLGLVAAPLWVPGALLVQQLQPRLRLPSPLLPLTSIAATGLLGYAVSSSATWSCIPRSRSSRRRGRSVWGGCNASRIWPRRPGFPLSSCLPFHAQLGLPHAEAHPQEQLRRFAEANGIAYLDLLLDLQRRLVRSLAGDEAARDPATRAELLRSLGAEQPERLGAFWRHYYLDGGHLNPRGHRWLAALLLPVVTELLGLERLPPGAAPDQLQAR